MNQQLPLNALELLSPARDADVGIAAIDHGADAVYIGGPSFGARAAAGNTLEDIARLADYAHRYNAKVFAALNTLFTNEELPQARRLAFELAAAGADVLIVQDMGLLMGELPAIEIHASTQCDIRTPEKAAFLEAVGFSQIVLARELSFEEIAAVRARLRSARIEFFVHGALCVSYSGRCFMSEAMTRRSANRGACSQLCRLPYDVETLAGEALARRSHVLSLKDNDQSAHLEALIDAGVSSFKIEGRLKDAAYVKNVTAFYRKKLDAILARRKDLVRASDGRSEFTFEPAPEKVFNRGATDYFLRGKHFEEPYEAAALESPKHTGARIARVVAKDAKTVTVELFDGVELANGDGLTYLDDHDEVRGLAVNGVEAVPLSRTRARGTSSNRASHRPLVRITPSEPVFRLEGLSVGTILSRNRDHAFLRQLAGKSARRRVPVTVVFTHHEDGLDLVITDGVACGSASVAMALEKPSDPEKNRKTLATNLQKLGDTIFEAESVSVPENLEVFVPASVANALRRAAVADLAAAREAARPKPVVPVIDRTIPYPEKVLGFTANVANDEARRFYEAHGARVTAPAFEIRPVRSADLMTCRHCVRAALSLCPKMLRYHPEWLEKHPREYFRPEPLILRNSAGERFEAQFHCRRSPCEMTIKKC